MFFKNPTLMVDLYELTMMQGYFENNIKDWAVFDLFYRKNPSGGGYAIAAGLDQVIEYIENIHFDDDDIEYLRSTGHFKEEFLEYLRSFRFTGDLYAIPEGTVVLPMEPLIKVVAPLEEAQFVETALLTIINHQSLIASKASRVVREARGEVMEFGLRRAQGPDAGIYGARAAMIAGCNGTSNVIAAQKFDVPVLGTHAHSWIMSFPSELEAFRKFASLYPDNALLLVDTYDVEEGVKNAIKVFDEMKAAGIHSKRFGIRLDSGDLAYFGKKSRAMLDEAGYKDAIISASSDLDEYLINSLQNQGCCITSWGVGTNMITSSDCPSFGGVYKLAEIIKEDGTEVPKIKVSENIEKVTNPGNKTVYRIYDKETGKIRLDLMCLTSEVYDESKPLDVFDPIATWKRTHFEPGEYTMRELLVQVYKKGKKVYDSPKVMEIRDYCMKEQDTLWEECLRLMNPQEIHVDLSKPLFDLKNELLDEAHNNSYRGR